MPGGDKILEEIWNQVRSLKVSQGTVEPFFIGLPETGKILIKIYTTGHESYLAGGSFIFNEQQTSCDLGFCWELKGEELSYDQQQDLVEALCGIVWTVYRKETNTGRLPSFLERFIQQPNRNSIKQTLYRYLKHGTFRDKEHLKQYYLSGGRWGQEPEAIQSRSDLDHLKNKPVEKVQLIGWLHGLGGSEEAFIKTFNERHQTSYVHFQDCLSWYEEQWQKSYETFLSWLGSEIDGAWEWWQEAKELKRQHAKEKSKV